MQLPSKFLQLTFILAGALCVGCGQEGSNTEQLIDTAVDSKPDRSSLPSIPVLTCSHQVYDKSGAREVHATLKDPDFSEIKAMLENAFTDESALRARILLTRNVDSGHIIVVTRMPDGKLELGVNMKIGDQWFEANQFDVESVGTVISIFNAFYDTDARIQTLIEWDEVVE